ncbi:XRE family transcriptional regulator [Levilactobacillus brevis]|nr:XRE family transcriptional regulator [Levilactobacillus brevis]
MQKAIGERIKYMRQRVKLSQEGLADKIGVNRAVMSRIENGTRPVRDIELSSLADVFEVTTDYLLGRKTDLGSVPVAAHIDGNLDDLTDEERQEINDYIEFKKAQYKKRHEKD